MTAPSSPALSKPRRIAIIMDGNGRWAAERQMDRSMGHLKGSQRVLPVLDHCVNLGVEALTIYTFSTENWIRSHEEVSGLMSLCIAFLAEQEAYMATHNVRFRHIGRRDELGADVLAALDRAEAATAGNTGIWFSLAFNYGSRAEITEAIRACAMRVAAGELEPADIGEAQITEHLYTAGIPDPDLLVRTAGDMRLSNFLLWQLSYAELYVTPKAWPDFTPADLDAAISAYGQRKRTFGGVVCDEAVLQP